MPNGKAETNFCLCWIMLNSAGMGHYFLSFTFTLGFNWTLRVNIKGCKKTKSILSALVFLGAFFSVFHRVVLFPQTEVLIFLNYLEFLSATHLPRQLSWKVSGNQLDTTVQYINHCIKPELTLLTATDPSALSAGYWLGLGLFPLYSLMDYINFLIRKLNFQVGFHLDYLKHLVLNLFCNCAFSGCNLSSWLR